MTWIYDVNLPVIASIPHPTCCGRSHLGKEHWCRCWSGCVASMVHRNQLILNCLEIAPNNLWKCRQRSRSYVPHLLHMKIQTNATLIPIISHHIFHWRPSCFPFDAKSHKKYIQKFTTKVWICRIRPPERWTIIWQFPSSVTKEWFLRSTPLNPVHHPFYPFLMFLTIQTDDSTSFMKPPKACHHYLAGPAPNQPFPSLPPFPKSIE